MKFEQIFEEVGLYTTESFRDGVGIEIFKNPLNLNEMKLFSYDSTDSIIHTELTGVSVSSNWFKKDFRRVYNRFELFGSKKRSLLSLREIKYDNGLMKRIESLFDENVWTESDETIWGTSSKLVGRDEFLKEVEKEIDNN